MRATVAIDSDHLHYCLPLSLSLSRWPAATALRAAAWRSYLLRRRRPVVYLYAYRLLASSRVTVWLTLKAQWRRSLHRMAVPT